jgi:hypothetical protein
MQRSPEKKATTVSLTVVALIAFASNSVLCRLALGEAAIDPASYTAVRLITGAVTLWMIAAFLRAGSFGKSGGSWISAAMLFLYAVTFSFAYISLSAGTGALILFAAVQITMIAVGLYTGERPEMLEWLGLFWSDLFSVSRDYRPFHPRIATHGHRRNRLGCLLSQRPRQQ